MTGHHLHEVHQLELGGTVEAVLDERAVAEGHIDNLVGDVVEVKRVPLQHNNRVVQLEWMEYTRIVPAAG